MKPAEVITQVVEDVQGCKLTELLCHDRVIALIQAEIDVPALVDEMVQRGDLLEVEYSVPSLPYRTKSFLLPKGSNVRTAKPNTKSYVIGFMGTDKWIRCLVCGSESYHTEDIRQLYCGRCRKFHPISVPVA